MAGQPATPSNMICQSANQQILVSWDQAVGATAYNIERSLDNVTYTALATVGGSPLATQYLDVAVTLGTKYWYRVNAQNGSGLSPFTAPQANVPTPTSEKTLGQIRLEAQQTADRINSNFVTKSEWNTFINLAMYELYDLLITVYEDYNIAEPASFTVNGSTFLYPLPNGSDTFLNGVSLQPFIPKPLYKLRGVDLALQNAANGFVTVNKFNFADRNRFVYPNTASTIYGVFNLQYRVMGDKIQFIPTPSANQVIRLWYIPRLTEMLADTDISDIGISGWLRYVIVRAAIYALTKEESDTTTLQAELVYLKQRIEESAANRDAGLPDRVSDTRQGSGYGDGWGSGNGSIGGI